jgi:hypothetical protein
VALVKNKDLLDRVVELGSDLPPQVTRMAASLMLEAMAEGLSEGREVCLRGFGRFIPRFYAKSNNKKLGILFHPSPRLLGKSGLDPLKLDDLGPVNSASVEPEPVDPAPELDNSSEPS